MGQPPLIVKPSLRLPLRQAQQAKPRVGIIAQYASSRGAPIKGVPQNHRSAGHCRSGTEIGHGFSILLDGCTRHGRKTRRFTSHSRRLNGLPVIHSLGTLRHVSACVCPCSLVVCVYRLETARTAVRKCPGGAGDFLVPAFVLPTTSKLHDECRHHPCSS